MRIAYSTVMTLLLGSAVPAIGLAQVLTPFSDQHPAHRLDRLVPVATVNLVGDVVALDDPLVVDDPTGEPFVLGAASLDLRDPSHAQIVFSMTNASSEPIPWNTVELTVRRVTPVPVEDQNKGAPALFFGCRHGALAGHASRPTSPKGAWQPGATVTVQVPVADDCLRRFEKADPLAFLVYAGSVLPHPDLLLGPSDPGWSAVGARNNALFRRAFEKLTEHSGRGNEWQAR